MGGKIDFRYNCKSIWNADWKAWKRFEAAGQRQLPAQGDTTKCEGVPLEVLTSQYSLDTWNGLWFESKTPGKSFVKEDEKWEPGNKKSAKAQRFRKSIDFICATCALFAESDSAKEALRSKCEAMGWSPEAYTEGPPVNK